MNDVANRSEVRQKACLFAIPHNQWSSDDAAGLSEPEVLLYRSNLLGSDLTVTNYGGGNTSAKIAQTDPLTREKTNVLWVKGSGGDIGSMALDGFATLYLDRLLGLESLYQGQEHEDRMVEYLPHCTFNLNSRAASIDTPLHAYLPYAHVDHVHPDALIALAASSGGEQLTQELWNGEIGWLPWKRPGFELGLMLRNHVADTPGLRGVMLAGHGVICWGETSKDCYDNTIGLIADAARMLNGHLAKRPAFGGGGGSVGATLLPRQRRAIAAKLMPKLRSLMTASVSRAGHFSDDDETLEFVGSRDFRRLAAIGTSCPDHFLRTKIAPLALDPDRLFDDGYLDAELVRYRDAYKAYYQRCAGPDDPAMRDPDPVIILVPGVGRMSFSQNKSTARIAGEFYANAINVMRGAEAIGEYVGLGESEAFNIEYWALEEAKLKRMPTPKPLAGRVALVTGGAGGIGAATARRLLAEGACVMLADCDEEALSEAFDAMAEAFNPDFVRKVVCDVTCEDRVQAAFDACVCEFGGLDILVANAGIASSAPLEETSIAIWNRNYDVLAKGYFLAARAAFPLMKQQGRGSIVFIGSKNALAAAANASAYASSKAAALHLARCLAHEGASFGVRVNTVNPDAVIKGSRIWGGDWRKERAGTHGISAGDELEAHYRNRSMLKLDVLPEDIAEAVLFFAMDISAKSTGNILNVDAGNAQAFTR